MKKVFCIVVFAILVSVNLYSQRVVALGNTIIQKNDITSSKSILNQNGFSLLSAQELRNLGHNPNTVIFATKGFDQSNSIMANVTTISQTNRGIKEAMFICSEPYAKYIVSDLRDNGYKEAKEREYMENGRFRIIEKTYQKRYVDHTNIAIVKFFTDGTGGAIITFSSKKSN